MVATKEAAMQAEVKHLERKWNKKGKPYITEPEEEPVTEEQKINWYERIALCVTRNWTQDNKKIEKTELHVNSDYLKEFLRDVIKTYPGQSFSTKNITIAYDPHCLYHYRKELAEAGKRFEVGSEGARHHVILMDYINEQFEDAIEEGDNLREQGLMSYDHLWTIFKPGSLVYATRLGQPRVYKLNSYYYGCDRCVGPHLCLQVEYVDFDGDDFGLRNENIKVPAFEGPAPISRLNAFPLHWHAHEDDVRKALTARGRTFEQLAGQNMREHSGIAFDFSENARKNRYNVDGRVMIDTKTFHRINTDEAFSVRSFPKSADMKHREALNNIDADLTSETKTEYVKLTDEQALLAAAMVRGFSFSEKKFLDFFVTSLAEIDFNEQCFDQLVLPSAQKETVQALVAEHTSASAGAFEDIVKGKGRGLVLVLHGPPGVGKTLTAECVAEFAHRPLYIVSSGDLGTDPELLDARLSEILDLASTWKAVLLIDEADVFLERRSLHDLQRNSLVSIFLRVLEYYSGILFMTTNRVTTFDDAFKSRIHVPLKYEDLPQESRNRIWRNFLSKIEGVEMSDEQYEKLSQGEVNGRTIKNVIRAAKSLAAYKGKRLDYEQLRVVMDIQTSFERDLEAGSPRGYEVVAR